jgi:predicted negative regulator of RcsB-dependent stress response
MFDQLDRAAQAGDADQAGRIFTDMKDRYPRTAFTEQGGLMAAKAQLDKGQTDAALGSLAWVAENGAEPEYQTIARLRAAGVLLDQKKYDDALKQLGGASSPDFAALVDDRRGDILLAQGKKDDAKAAYTKAWQAMDPKIDYRRLIEAKLTAMGAAPAEAVKTAEVAK